ncbi:uncharacterized protein [Rhodnius prolixus]|uniref:uncharacterized protein n=1 Tax=Rhodnius prolixus TaxID=13249 RepID=UPI003D18F028
MTWSILFLLLVAVTIYGVQEVCYNCTVYKENDLMFTNTLANMLNQNSQYGVDFLDIISGYTEPLGDFTLYEIFFEGIVAKSMNETLFCETVFEHYPKIGKFVTYFLICSQPIQRYNKWPGTHPEH